MAINTQKFLPSSKGSAIVKASKKTIKASSFVSNAKTEDVSGSIQKISKDYSLGFLSERLLNDISFVRVKVIEIDKLLKGTLANEKKEIVKRKREEEKKRFEKTETKLEVKPNIRGGKLPVPSLPKMGILDWIKNFIKNVVIGYFAIRLIKYLPKIMPIVKTIASIADFTIDFAGKLLDGLVTFIDWAYKAHDATSGFLKDIGGENFVKLFDKFNGAIGTLIETAIIASIIASTQRGDSFIDTPTKGGRTTVTRGKGGSRFRSRLPGTRPTVTQGRGRLPGTRPGIPRLPGAGPTVTQGRGRLPGTRPGIPRLPGTGPTVTQGRGGSGIFSRINKFFSGVGSKVTSRIPKVGPFAKLALAMGKVGKVAGKAIPFVSAVIGITEGINRLSKGDTIGAGLSFGTAIPVLGWGFLAADIIRSTVGNKTFDEFYLNNIIPFLIPGVGGFVKQFLDKTGVTKKIIRQNEKNKQSQSIGFGEILKGFGGGYVKPKPKRIIKVIKSAEGGKVKSSQVTRGGKVLGGVKRSIKATRKGKYRRKLSPKKPQEVKITSPGVNVGGEQKIFGLFPNPLKMVKDATKKVSDVVNPFNVIKKTGETLGKSDYFGPILSITSKILLGQKPEQQDYKNVGLGINLLVSKGIDEGKLKGGLMAAFAEGGFVDPKSLDAITEGGDISDWVAKAFKESTETNAQKTLREIQQNLKLKKDEKTGEPSSVEEPVLDDGSGGAGGGGGSSYGSPEMKALLDVLAYAEGTTENRNGATGPPGYSTWAGYQIHGPTNLTTQTIQQVHDLQTSFMRAGKQRVTGSAVVGRYQFKDLKTHFAKQAGLKDTDLFSPANQDKMAIKEIERAGVTTEMLKKNGLTTAAMDKLAPIWASIPYSPKGGRSYYGQAFKNPQKLIELYNQKLKIKRDAAISRPGYSGSPDLSNVPRGDTSRAASRLLREFPRIRTRDNPQQIYASGLGFWMKKNFPTPGEPSRRGTGDYGDPAGGRDQMEHPDHGGVVASHRGRGHYIGRALDLGGFGGGRYTDQDNMWPYVVKFMKTYGLDSPSTLPQVWHAPGENYGPKHSGGPDGGHQNHLHVEFAKGGMTPNKSTYAIVGEKGREFVIDADSTAAIESFIPGFLNAINKAKYIDATRVLKNYAVKEIMSDNGFMSALNKSKYEEVSNIVSSYADRELNPKTEFLSKSSSGKYKDSITPLSSYAEYESGSEQIVTIPQVIINNIISEYEEQSPMIMMGSSDGGDDPFESMYMMS